MFGGNAFGWAYPGRAYGGTTAGGGTTYPQSLSGGMSFAGAAPVFGMQRGVTGGFAPAGSLSRVATLLRTLTATLTPTGALTRTLSLLRTLTATLTPTGALTRALTLFRTVTGALSFSGSAKRAANRSLAGVLTSSGVLARSTTRLLTGGFTPTASLLASILRIRSVTAVFTPTGSMSGVKRVPFTQALSAVFGAAVGNYYFGGPMMDPDSPSLDPDGLGGFTWNLNRVLTAALALTGTASTSSARVRTFTATLQPHVTFFKTSARVFLAAEFSAAALVGVRASHTVGQALFASLRAAGSFSTILDPGTHNMGGGGFGVPMPDSFFMRYKPTLRRQKVKV